MAMPTITITRAANEAIRSASRTPNSGYYDMPKGAAEKTIELDDETFERLVANQMAGETISDVIVRSAAFYRAGGRTN